MANREQIARQSGAARKALKKTQSKWQNKLGVNKSTLSF